MQPTGGSLRDLQAFSTLGANPAPKHLSHPAHQRLTQTVGQQNINFKGYFFMETEVIVALIAAVASVIGAITAVVISVTSLKVERKKLESERIRITSESDKLQAEIGKLFAETEKIKSEMDDELSQQIELKNAQLELDKQQATNLYEKRNSIYPELLELVYRLRNQLRESLVDIENEIDDPTTELIPYGPGELGQDLYFLTENLYKYRAFIDQETFDELHRFKRLLQDAKIILNRSTRPINYPEGDMDFDERQKILEEEKKMFLSRVHESYEPLKEIFTEVDSLYLEITKSVHQHVEKILGREASED